MCDLCISQHIVTRFFAVSTVYADLKPILESIGGDIPGILRLKIHTPMGLNSLCVMLIFLLLINYEYCYCRKRCFFVDLFVRVSNAVAVDMYHRLGYIIYRKVLDYYSGDTDEDAYGE